METISLELTPQMLMMVPLVATVLQLIKNFEPLAELKQWFPVMALAVGIGVAYIQKMPNPIITGALIGLTASGSYDVLKGKKINKI